MSDLFWDLSSSMLGLADGAWFTFVLSFTFVLLFVLLLTFESLTVPAPPDVLPGMALPLPEVVPDDVSDEVPLVEPGLALGSCVVLPPALVFWLVLLLMFVFVLRLSLAEP